MIPLEWVRMFGSSELQLLISGDQRRIDIAGTLLDHTLLLLYLHYICVSYCGNFFVVGHVGFSSKNPLLSSSLQLIL